MSLSNPLESIFDVSTQGELVKRPHGELYDELLRVSRKACGFPETEPVEDSGPVAAETIEEMKRRYLAMQAAEYRIDAANLAVLGETIKCSPGEIEEYGFDPQRYIESGGEWHGAAEPEAGDFGGFCSQVSGEEKVYADEDTLQFMQTVPLTSDGATIGEVTVAAGQIISVTITNGGPWYKAEDVLIATIYAIEDEPDIAEITRSVAKGS